MHWHVWQQDQVTGIFDHSDSLQNIAGIVATVASITNLGLGMMYSIRQDYRMHKSRLLEDDRAEQGYVRVP
ncbi:MAG: hypothetical protein P1U63_09105 [Coxiellaceae bacterium]|nr:hypothetical protein [Coxiellaceae bacterium]